MWAIFTAPLISAGGLDRLSSLSRVPASLSSRVLEKPLGQVGSIGICGLARRVALFPRCLALPPLWATRCASMERLLLLLKGFALFLAVLDIALRVLASVQREYTFPFCKLTSRYNH